MNHSTAASAAEPGVFIHEDGGAKIHISKASGANEPTAGVIALSPAFIGRLYRASRARRRGAS